MTWREERGETLVEVLLAVVIIGVGVTGLLGGLGTGVLMSGVQQQHAVTETDVRHVAEAVRAAPFVPCLSGPADDYLAAAPPVDSTVLPMSVLSWDGDSFETVCPTTDILQLVTVSVESPDPKVGVVSLEVAKRAMP